MLKLFHNIRASLHIPDQPPEKLPPASGPGRNDAFGLLSAVLFGQPQPYAPVKYGVVWNLDKRRWVHWDGNTRSPIGRNLLASLGLGAPLVGKHGQLDFALIKRQTDLSETIRPPRYPFAIDAAAARRGAAHYEEHCASCHAKLDPYGLALENYDAIGQWRDRANGEGFRGPKTPVLDVSGAFPDGIKFATLEEFKAGLLAKKDKFARAFSTKMLTYALCRPVGYTDRQIVDSLTEELRRNDYRIQALIYAIVASEPFNKK